MKAWLLGLLLSSVHPQSLTMSAVLITDPTMTRMVALTERGGKCTYSLDRSYIRRRVLDAPRYMVREETEDGMDALMEACQQRDDSSGFVYPGTKWCGPGNKAVSYEDLGRLEAEDRCCREHDHCPAQLAPGECKNGICNDSPFTRSHCDCDARFMRCLQTVNSSAANTIGAIFFNVVQVMCFKERRACASESHCDCDDRFYQCLKDVIARTRPLVAVTVGTVYFNVAAPQCFDEDYPIVKCLEEHGLFRRRCVSYELDKSRPKEWQWFDAKFF
ncbi:phospholipase A2 imperatoxin-1 [Anabrus simplex]|uniref:phospholipase A2 imperatoxin-1 n=1 Tax=Anabrus simplex TaxID=316456 RepID=UPI0035A349D1